MEKEVKEGGNLTNLTLKCPLEYRIETKEVKAKREEQERTTKKKEEVLEAFTKLMGTISLATAQAGISRETFYKWYEVDPEFRAKVERVRRGQRDEVEDKLFKAILKEESWAISLYLNRRHPLYRPKQESLIGPIGGVKSLEELLDEYQQQDETTTTEQSIDREAPLDKIQEGGEGAISAECGTGLLLAKENTQKLDFES